MLNKNRFHNQNEFNIQGKIKIDFSGFRLNTTDRPYGFVVYNLGLHTNYFDFLNYLKEHNALEFLNLNF